MIDELKNTDKKCPTCKGEITDHRSGCDECEQFQCAGCGEWVSWDFGADDAEENRPLCDDCSVEENDDDSDDDLVDDGELDLEDDDGGPP